MSDQHNYRKLRIFVAYPDDVQEECKRVKLVADELSRTGNLADNLGLTLEVLDWRTHVAPAMGNAEQVTLDELPVEIWDILVGILWMRFGTPPGGVNPQNGEAFASGTEREFTLAYHFWQRHQRPQILFYRCRRAVDPDHIDHKQHEKVKAFFENFGADQKHEGFFKTYVTTDEFQQNIHQDLTRLLIKYNNEVLKKAPPSRVLVSEPKPRESLEVLQRRYLEKLQTYCNLLPLAALAKENDPHASLSLTLDRVYIGLNTTLSVDKEGKLVQREMMERREERERVQPLTALAAAAREQKLVILGDPGSGKSSFINHLLWQLAERYLHPGSPVLADWSPRDCFPVLILLRELLITLQQQNAAQYLNMGQAERRRHFCHCVLQHLRRMLEKDHLSDFAPALESTIANGRCLVVFDGLDEAPPEQRSLLRHAVENFSADAGRDRFLVTCRILSYVKEAELPSFTGVTLAPFDEKQMDDFIVHWYRALHQLGKPEDWAADKSADLQKAVRRLPVGMVRNPLLLTTLASLHANNVELPRQRVKLYQKASELLLLRWREEKIGKTSLLEELNLKDDLEIYHALWELGYFAQDVKRGSEATDIPESAAMQILKNRFSRVENPWSAAEKFLKFVDQTAGLLLSRGGASGNVYAFLHRTFQEYFAGCYLAKLAEDFEEVLQEKLLPEGDYWRLTAQLGVEEILYLDRREKAATKLTYALCPTSEPDLQDTAAWRGILWSAYFALEIGQDRITEDKRKEGGPAFLERLRQRLTTLFEHGLLPARERADAGFALGKLGDPREGVCTLPPVFVALPGGKFVMGSKEGEDEEKPPHQVELSPFKISIYPITNAQFEAFMKAGGYQEQKWWSTEGWQFRQEQKLEQPRYRDNDDFNLPNQPVVGVSWFEAEAFCAWLTAEGMGLSAEGKKQTVRLPTEAEWEFAARGSEGRKYPWGPDQPTPEHANHDESKIGRPTTVGAYPRGGTPDGVFDLAGNVWEWCQDWYSKKYYAECKKKGVVKNPAGPGKGDLRVLRGAAYYSSALRGSQRNRAQPGRQERPHRFPCGGARRVLKICESDTCSSEGLLPRKFFESTTVPPSGRLQPPDGERGVLPSGKFHFKKALS
ncbi:MAG: SUMF1/EgtB/PvdO family nonheme iron enzyme [bacterium]